MKDYWKLIASMALPILEAAGIALENADGDPNDSDDAKDMTGHGLRYAAQIIKDAVAGRSITKAPAVLR